MRRVMVARLLVQVCTLIVPLFAVAACSSPKGETVELSIALHTPESPDPFENVTTLRAQVLRAGAVVATTDTDLADNRIEIPGVPREGGPLTVEVLGLDGSGTALSRGRTRMVDPYDTQGPYGLMFLQRGVFSTLVPRLPVAARGAALASTPRSVVIVGGLNDLDSALAAAWRYDLDTAELQSLPDMNTARGLAGAVTLSDGRVVVIGGTDGTTDLSSTEVYDPQTDAWTPGPSLANARRSPHVIVVGGTRIVVASGDTEVPAEWMDIDGATTGGVANSTSRADAAVVQLRDRSVLVIGGLVGGAAVDTVEQIDSSGVSAALVPGLIRNAHSGAGAVQLDSGDVLVAGGDRGTGVNGERFLSAAEWVASNGVTGGFAPDRLNTRRARAAMSGTPEGVLVVGGRIAGGVPVPGAEWYDGSRFVTTPALAAARDLPSTQAMVDDTVLVTGGQSEVLEVFQPGDLADAATRVDLAISTTVPPAPSPDPFPPAAAEVVYTLFDAAGPFAERTADPATAPAPGVGTVAGPAVTFSGFRIDGDITARVETRAGDGTVLAWGGVVRPLTPNDYSGGTLTFFVGAVNAWTLTDDMTHDRDDSAAFTLADGTAIVSNGAGSDNSTAEIFDPHSASFGAPFETGTDRGTARATQLLDGTVLVTSTNGGSVALDVFDPLAGAFSVGDTLTDARSFNSLTLMADGRAVAVGGRTGAGATLPNVQSAEIFDAGAWGAPIATVEARQRHRAALSGNGDVIVAGGQLLDLTDPMNPVPVVTDTTEIFNGAAFVAGPALAVARRDHAMITLPNGSVMVCGGIELPATMAGGANNIDTCETLAPGGGAWVTSNALSAPRDDLILLEMADGTVWAVGGSVPNNPNTVVDIVFPAPAAPGPALNIGRALLSGTVLMDGRAVVFGGEANPTAEMYTTSSWTNPFVY